MKVNDLKSTGIRSEFLFFDYPSDITDRNEYLVVKSPRNPKYISGNFLLFPKPPEKGDLERWPDLFKKEFKDDANIHHMKLVWDGVDGDIGVSEPFFKAGFELESYQTLLASSIKDPKSLNEKLDIREIKTPEEWEAVTQDQDLFRAEALSEEYYRGFFECLMNDYKKIMDKGECKWLGAFCGDELVGSLGILWDKEMAGFQRIVVKPQYRKQGICTALLKYASEYTLKNLGVEVLVILTEQGSDASRVYRSLGFESKEKLRAFYKYP